jgi:hypothetical protein
LSDFDLWHYVLNYWYLPESEAEGEEFELELKQYGLSKGSLYEYCLPQRRKERQVYFLFVFL